MEGITILYTYTYTPGKLEFIFCACMFVLCMTISGALLPRDKCMSLFAAVATIIFLIGCIFTYSLRLNSRERYEVIIDNKSVNFSEFNEKYRAIEVRGKIYTIEERNPYSNCGAKMEQEAR